MKRGQVTIFIIIGVVILLTLLFFWIALPQFTLTFFPEKLIRNQIEGCLKSTAEDGLKLLGKQGGYINIPTENHIIVQNLDRTILLKNEKSNLPTIEKIETELEYYINHNILSCVKENAKNPKARVTITKDIVQLYLKMPVTIIKKDREIEINQFTEKIKAKLPAPHKCAEDIINFQKTNPMSINISQECTLYASPIPPNLISYRIEDKGFSLIFFAES